MQHMTAKVSCFARAYHFKNNIAHVFADSAAQMLLGEDYDKIAESMTQGAGFFLPDFSGTPQDALRIIVDCRLSPSVLGRSAFCEAALENAIGFGCRQYVVFAAGYDSYALRNPYTPIRVFELDLPEMISDKRRRVQAAGLTTNATYVPCDLADGTWRERLLAAGFSTQEKSFGSLLGISYYLTKSELKALLHDVGRLMASGSAICLDYPCEAEDEQGALNRTLAKGAGEEMKARYSPAQMLELLSDCGFAATQQLGHEEMTARHFAEYNRRTPQHKMSAPLGVGYILAAKADEER